MVGRYTTSGTKAGTDMNNWTVLATFAAIYIIGYSIKLYYRR